jgi:hypothetical protein
MGTSHADDLRKIREVLVQRRRQLVEEARHRFCQGSRHDPWPTRAWLGIGLASHSGADKNAVYRMRLGSRDGATGAHRPGLPPVPLPRLWQTVQ